MSEGIKAVCGAKGQVGYVVAVSSGGYGGKIKILVGIDNDFDIKVFLLPATMKHGFGNQTLTGLQNSFWAKRLRKYLMW